MQASKSAVANIVRIQSLLRSAIARRGFGKRKEEAEKVLLAKEIKALEDDGIGGDGTTEEEKKEEKSTAEDTTISTPSSPASDTWTECWDEDSQAYYYCQLIDPYATSWDPPPGWNAKDKEVS